MTRARQWLRRLRASGISSPKATAWKTPTDSESIEARINLYLAFGRKPWTEGYVDYKERYLSQVFKDTALMDRFRNNAPLPSDYGYRLDERVIEYPWVLSRLKHNHTLLLDAGATLIFPFLLLLPLLEQKTIIVYTLAPESWVFVQPNVSYIYGDLRETILKGNLFQEIVCISTLDHIGMDNTSVYSADTRHREARPNDYLVVVGELSRLLAPGGRVLLTVPFGKHQDLGWMQQFNQEMVEHVIETFGGTLVSGSYFKYTAGGWSLAKAADCAECSYFDVHRSQVYGPDYAPAARAVACVELVK